MQSAKHKTGSAAHSAPAKETMNKTILSVKRLLRYSPGSLVITALLLTLFCSHLFAENPKQDDTKVSSSFSARHVLGLPNAHPNASGSLSVDSTSLRFAPKDQGMAVVSIASIETVLLSQQDKQIGGTPMMLGKAAVPFGGGRAVSLFSHKKYDDVALIYRDDDGGIHGVIFELSAGEGTKLRDELVSNGAHVRPTQNAATALPNPGVSDGKN